MQDSERRSSPRVKFPRPVPAEVTNESNQGHLASIVDLSAGGARLRCGSQLEDYASISVLFSSNFAGSDNYIFLIDAEVVYLSTITDGDCWEYGIRFVPTADDPDGTILADTTKMIGSLCQQYQVRS